MVQASIDEKHRELGQGSESAPPSSSLQQTSTKLTVEIRGLEKRYARGKQQISVLQGLDMSIKEASFEALMGPSGSGKSTLLNLIAGLDRPDAGTVRVAGTTLNNLSDEELSAFRAQTIGFIFQTFNLMPVLTAAENVELPLLLSRLPAQERKRRAQTALKVVGLADRVHHYPRELSGGQEQRVAIARAIVSDPKLIVADEPTGDLDRGSAEEILNLLRTLNTEFGKTIVMVTHDPAAAAYTTRVHKLDKGSLV